MGTATDEADPKPLNMSCRTTKCEADQHCFLPNQRMARRKQKGPCRSCGKEMVDFKRLEKRDIGDIGNTVAMLKLERIRHLYWCEKEVDPKALALATRAGRARLRTAAGEILRKSVEEPTNPIQGRQTPWGGNIIFYAQHATACCCRVCIEVWHGISRKEKLAPDHLAYFAALIELYIQHRLPGLTDEGDLGLFLDLPPGG